MIRIALADDHRLFVDGLRDALDAVPDLRVVGIAGDTDALLANLITQPADVVLLDLEMPGGGGEEALRRIDDTPAIVVSMHVTSETVERLLAEGAAGVLSKSEPLPRLAAAVRAVAAGEILPANKPELDAVLTAHSEPELDPGAASLTDRERELLQMLASGVTSTEELAEQLYISQKTVKNHLAAIFQKLAVSDRTQAAIEAIRLGLARGD